MEKTVSIAEYFEPVDQVAEKLIRELENVPDESVREFRRSFLDHYEESKGINPKLREWKRLITQPPVKNLKLAEPPVFKEYESPRLPGNRGDFAGVADIEEGHINYWIQDVVRKQNVQFCHFDKAIREHLIDEAQIERMRSIEGRDRFSLLTMGAANHTLCLSIPENVHIDKPFMIKIENRQENVILPIVVNIFAGKNATAEIIIEESSSISGSQQSLIPFEVQVFAEESAEIDLVELQQFNKGSQLFSNQHFFLLKNASFNYLLIDQGGGIVKRNMTVRLDGEGAEATLTGLYHPKESQKFIYDTHQDHNASRTKSDLMFKGVLDEDAYSLWQGNVFVAKGTKGADGYQKNNNLMLDASAHAESIPGLEIIADDVRCSHGVTLSDIDEEQLFYLKSRGIAQDEGTRLIVNGFTRDALPRVRSDDLRAYAFKALGFGDEF